MYAIQIRQILQKGFKKFDCACHNRAFSFVGILHFGLDGTLGKLKFGGKT